MARKFWFSIVLVAVLALSAVAAACGDGGAGAEDKAEVEQAVSAVENFFGFTREECKDNAQDCVGDPPQAVSLANTKVSGDTATTEGTFTFSAEEGEETFLLSLVREDGVWKLDELRGVPKEIPQGVKKIDLDMAEFAFSFDAAQIEDGNFAFVAKNVGEQPHQVIVDKIPADLNLQEALQSEQEPEGVQNISFDFPLLPGDEGNVVFDQPLEPGRYSLVCFVPDRDDPERTPHALKGMYADFTIP